MQWLLVAPLSAALGHRDIASCAIRLLRMRSSQYTQQTARKYCTANTARNTHTRQWARMPRLRAGKFLFALLSGHNGVVLGSTPRDSTMKRKQADTLDKLLGKLYSAGFVVIPFHNLRECREIESVANVSLAPLCQLLEGETELTREQRIVLIATRSYKSSYAGVGNY